MKPIIPVGIKATIIFLIISKLKNSLKYKTTTAIIASVFTTYAVIGNTVPAITSIELVSRTSAVTIGSATSTRRTTSAGFIGCAAITTSQVEHIATSSCSTRFARAIVIGACSTIRDD